MRWRGALALGLLLSQGGEFGFVLFTRAQQGLLIEPSAASLFGAIVTLSMATTPFLMMATKRIRQEPNLTTAGARGRGATGPARWSSAMAGSARRWRRCCIAVGHPGDADRHRYRDDRRRRVTFGAKVYFGDGTRIDLLRQAGAAEAEPDPVLPRRRRTRPPT